jgi:hypothetical protein
LGTRRDNNRDKVKKGRDKHPKGEDIHSAVLTESIVREVRLRPLVGRPIAHWAREFGVTRATMRRAVHGVTWKHVGYS